MVRILIFCILLFASAIHAAPYLAHDFESGSFSSPTINTYGGFFSPRQVSDGCNVSVVSGISHSGNYAVQCQYRASDPASTAGGAELGFNLGTVQNEVYIQFYAYFPDGTEPGEVEYLHTDGGSTDNNKFLRLWNNDYNYGKWGASLNWRPGTTGSELFARGNDDGGCGDNETLVPMYDVHYPAKGEWELYEFHIKPDSGAGDGIWELWVDGVYKDGQTDIATAGAPCSPTGFLQGYIMGYANSHFDNVTNVYIDDIIISDSYIGMDSPPVPDDVYYVSNSGDDNNTGLAGSPWRTISKVNSASFSPGDSILFNRGDTWNEQLVIPSDGSAAGGYITFGAYGTGDRPVIEGTGLGLARYQGLIQSSGRSYFILENLDVRDAGYIQTGGVASAGDEIYGINLAIGTHHAIVRDSLIYRTEACSIHVRQAHDILIENNESELCCMRSMSECISVSGQSYNVEVAYNEVHNNGNSGVHNGGSGIDLKEGTYDSIVHHNEVYNLHGTQGIYADAWNQFTGGIEIYNNYVHDFTTVEGTGTGIHIGTEQGGTLDNIWVHHNIVENVNNCFSMHPGRGGEVDTVQNAYIYNNTFYACGNASSDYYGGALLRNPDISNINIKNNIFSQNRSFQVGFSNEVGETNKSNYNIDTNIIHGSVDASGSIDGTAGTNSIQQDPLFINPGTDFTLQASSPAIAACDSSVWEGIPNITDYDGVSITDASGNLLVASVSCGAYESTSYTLTVIKSGTGSGTVTSNPVGIDCGSTCSINFAGDSEIQLFASGDPVIWGQDCNILGQVTMSEDKTCTAVFTQPQQYSLTINKDETNGSGIITSTPVGIDCGSTCSSSFNENENIDLISVGDDVVWTGDCFGTGNILINIGTSNKNCTATYDSGVPAAPVSFMLGSIPVTH